MLFRSDLSSFPLQTYCAELQNKKRNPHRALIIYGKGVIGFVVHWLASGADFDEARTAVEVVADSFDPDIEAIKKQLVAKQLL
jgi:hypothetical protein